MKYLIIALVTALLIFLVCSFIFQYGKNRYYRPRFDTVEDVINLFPTSKEEIELRVRNAIKKAQSMLEPIYGIKPETRTFSNTMRALDVASEHFRIVVSSIEILSLVSPDDSVRNAAHKGLIELKASEIDLFSLNPRLYAACAEYETLQKKQPENLSQPESYFLKIVMEEFRRNGLQLPPEKQEIVKKIKKELAEHETNYDRNIAASQGFITATKEELKGLADSYINTLRKNEKGLYILGTDYPTYFKVIKECAVASTREKLYKEYNKKAYPENEKELADVIRLRDELAKALGFQSFAHYDIGDQMAKTPEKVQQFLGEVTERAQPKATQEVLQFKKDLPKEVNLTKDGKFYGWDFGYVMDQYKKKHLEVNEAIISEYFPLDHTLAALLNVYEKFFGVTFKKVDVAQLWHKDVRFLAAYKEGTYLGMIILDLFPRPFKYSHMAQATIVPPVLEKSYYPSVLFLVGNFPVGTDEQPALLTRQDVITFFHEFGHVMHALLGKTSLSIQSSVKGDFVEMPSQAFEEWVWDPGILKLVSSHYKTKEPLSDELIDRIRNLKTIDSGFMTVRQLSLARLSLDYFLEGADKDTFGIYKKLCEIFMPYMEFDPDNRVYCAFTHLMGYSAKYYGYLWSKVYALDIFYYILPQGLLNPAIGSRFAEQVLSKGGSDDPMNLLKNFLGREPSSDAFFKDQGF